MDVPKKLTNLIFVLDDISTDTSTDTDTDTDTDTNTENDDNQILMLQEMYYNNYISLKKRMFIYLYILIILITYLTGITLLITEDDKRYGCLILIIGIIICLGTSFINFLKNYMFTRLRAEQI